MKKVTKIMAMLVVLVMATGMVAFPAFAEETFATEKNVFVADTFERGVTEETEITSLGAGTLAAASGVTIVNDSAYGNVLRVNREIGDTGEGDKFVITYSVGGANKIVTDMDFKINQDVHYVYSVPMAVQTKMRLGTFSSRITSLQQVETLLSQVLILTINGIVHV